jgi:hypothetical protein
VVRLPKQPFRAAQTQLEEKALFDDPSSVTPSERYITPNCVVRLPKTTFPSSANTVKGKGSGPGFSLKGSCRLKND